MNQLKYSRIDAGQKRERYERSPRIIQDRAPNGQMTGITPSERSRIVAEALERIPEGDSLRQIAADLGCSYESLRIWMLSEQPQAYKQAVESSLIARIVYSDKELDDAQTPLDIARARESARFARWDAERRLPHLFGPKQEITHTIKPEFTVVLKDTAEVLPALPAPKDE